MAETFRYSGEFFRHQAPESIRSAERVVPVLVGLTHPKSVVDVGCGVGAWLSVFQRHGVEDICGIDGDWVHMEQLRIDPAKFLRIQLGSPFCLERRFDMALSLEVGEHLPGTSSAGFVESLVKLAPVVVFSAAVPLQGGTNHINEQWPEFWVGLFDRAGYEVFDVVRPRIWSFADVCYWYRQNTLVFVDRREQSQMNALTKAATGGPRSPLSLVHPDLLQATHQYYESFDIRHLCRRVPRAMGITFGKVWRRLRGSSFS